MHHIGTESTDASPEGALHEGVRARAALRRPAAPPQRWLRVALAIALLAHALLGWWLRDLMQPQGVADEERISVRLIDPVPDEPALPQPPTVPARPSTAAPPQSAPLAATRMPATPASPRAVPAEPEAPALSLQLYKADGSISLPTEAATQDKAPHTDFVPRSTAPSTLMAPHRPLKMRPNYFAKVWHAPKNETLLGETLRSIGDYVEDNLTVQKEFTTPSGTKIKCKAGFMFIMAAAGCGWGFAPEWGKPTAHWKPATELDEE